MQQFQLNLPSYSRGFHIITDAVLDQIHNLPQTGLLHLFIQHTSAGICINENADPSVLADLNAWFSKNVKENEPYYQHTFEGPDDMPAHIKTILTGCEITIPITNGRLNLGTWQGIYLGEFRNHGGSRNLIATVYS
ncbi:MAG: secondary thiamine-phosphate synthase enzyme [Crocinitomix sp.]|jgi:secondary thiamine-phosphate synthase enzyme